jgi:sugar (pentulose or hexulose) kinase
MTSHLIGLDLGSSALKAVLASADTGVVAVAERVCSPPVRLCN